jgi:hypothetical protein
MASTTTAQKAIIPLLIKRVKAVLLVEKLNKADYVPA